MRWMGLDYGTKTIGVAVSDPLGWTAQGITTIKRQGRKADLDQLRHLVKEYEVTGFVLGLPKRTDGSEGPEVDAVRKFSRTLEGVFQCPVQFWDERFSTKAASEVLMQGNVRRENRKEVVDKIAAVIILQSFLDANSQDAEGGNNSDRRTQP